MAKKKKKEVLKPLTAKERVEVLKDAVKQLNANKYTTNSGSYITEEFMNRAAFISEASKGFGKDKNKVDLKSFVPIILKDIKKEGGSCGVCAKGALAISAIAKLNSCVLGKGEKLSELASKRIQILFGKENADRMERYFEDFGANYGEEEAYNRWMENYPDEGERLLAIFANAIKNNGIFTP